MRAEPNWQAVPATSAGLMYRMYRHVLPEVDNQLKRWQAQAEAIPDRELRLQALQPHRPLPLGNEIAWTRC